MGLWSKSCQKRVSLLFHLFIFPLGFNFDSQFFQIFILYLDLPLIANSSNFYSLWTYLWLPVFQVLILLIWTYSLFPVKLIHIHLPGLTFECQFGLCFDFVALVYLIGLTPLMPAWSCFDFVTHVYRVGLTPLMPSLLGFETFWKPLIWLNYLFSSEGLSKAFIECKTLFHSISLFQIRRQIFDAMCHAMYDCARMKCPSIFWILFPFSSFLFSTWT